MSRSSKLTLNNQCKVQRKSPSSGTYLSLYLSIGRRKADKPIKIFDGKTGWKLEMCQLCPLNELTIQKLLLLFLFFFFFFVQQRLNQNKTKLKLISGALCEMPRVVFLSPDCMKKKKWKKKLFFFSWVMINGAARPCFIRYFCSSES